MAWGVRWYLVGSVVLGVLGVLAGCSGGNMFAEREPWRAEAEAQCINAGAVKESAGIVRIKAIRGPGMCGADFPLRVAALGEGGTLGYSDEVRPPSAIPRAAAQPRWPGNPPAPSYEPSPYEPQPMPYPARQAPPPSRIAPAPRHPTGEADGPISLSPNGPAGPARAAPEPYDFRKPYGAAPPPPAPPPPAPPPRSVISRDASPPVVDLSPVPYERRRVIDATRAEPHTGSARNSVRADPLPPTEPVRASVREPPPVLADRPRAAPVPPLGPARGAVTGSIGPVAMSPAATLACPLVSVLEQWLANDVQPAALRWFGSPVVEIKQISAYSCRGMNGNPNARISEHAFGNALDIASFTLADGHKITVKNGWQGSPEEQGFLRDVQGAACEQFNTVLAPGSNVFHYDHIHVDLMRRRGGRRACNPDAVPGEVVAARAGGSRYAGKRGSEPAVTGAVASRGMPPSRGKRSDPDDDRRSRALPLAEPGNDGEDDD
jgi:hypothetical protein